ncbi:hypothetical protein N9K06_01145 [Omnitrophica bacterium]|nr:hypothetical protein [Candidatus Omnitrophota bacterium]
MMNEPERFEQDVRKFKRDILLYTAAVCVFWLQALLPPRLGVSERILESPVLRGAMGVWFLLELLFGVAIFVRIRIISEKIGKKDKLASLCRIGTLFLLLYGGPSLFGWVLLMRVRSMRASGEIGTALSQWVPLSRSSKIKKSIVSLILFAGVVACLAAIATPGLKTAKSHARYREGVALMNKGAYGQAVVKFQQSLEDNPRLTDAYFDAGICLNRLGRLPEARKQMERYLELVSEQNKLFEGSDNGRFRQPDEKIAQARRILNPK